MTRREPPPELTVDTAERSWQTEGPNSSGIAGWWLYQGHMYWWSTEFGGYQAHGTGTPVADWVKRYGRSHRVIVRDLEGE